MNKLHIIPTDKPSRLQLNVNTKKLILFNNIQSNNESAHLTTQNIYITSDEEIKEGDWVIYNNDLQKSDGISFKSVDKKIILTTDQDLINDGVQAIDDEFLQWFVKNLSCEFEVEPIPNSNWGFDIAEPITLGYKIIIPQEEQKQETLEEAAERIYPEDEQWTDRHIFNLGAKWQQERMYSEEDFKLFARQFYREIKMDKSNLLWEDLADKCLEQFKKK
jgi:hypothetical protein